MKSKKRSRRNPYRGEHSARLRSPRGFTAFRRQNNRFGPGRHVIFGLRRGRAVVLALRFDSRRYSPKAARAWLRRHKLRCLEFRQARRKPRQRPASNPKLGTTALRDPRAMTAAEINKELDRLDAQNSDLTDRMIAAGRGHEKPSEYLQKSRTDPLSMEAQSIFARRTNLRNEIVARYGPNAPWRLPAGRGFSPRVKPNPASNPTLSDRWRRVIWSDWLKRGGCGLSGESYSMVCKLLGRLETRTLGEIEDAWAPAGRELAKFATRMTASNPKPPKLGTIWPYGAKIKVIEGNMWKTISVVPDLPPAINNEILKLRRRGVRDLWVFHAWGEQEYVGTDKLSGEQREQQRQSNPPKNKPTPIPAAELSPDHFLTYRGMVSLRPKHGPTQGGRSGSYIHGVGTTEVGKYESTRIPPSIDREDEFFWVRPGTENFEDSIHRTYVQAQAALRQEHQKQIKAALALFQPVSASAVAAYGIPVPSGYVLEGERYIYKRRQRQSNPLQRQRRRNCANII